jgi:hypothetical protein
MNANTVSIIVGVISMIVSVVSFGFMYWVWRLDLRAKDQTKKMLVDIARSVKESQAYLIRLKEMWGQIQILQGVLVEVVERLLPGKPPSAPAAPPTPPAAGPLPAVPATIPPTEKATPPAAALRPEEESLTTLLKYGSIVAKLFAYQRKKKEKENFVSAKWFREVVLNDKPGEQKTFQEAIDKGLIKTYKVANPKKPEYPTTACAVDEKNPIVGEILKRFGGGEGV